MRSCNGRAYISKDLRIEIWIESGRGTNFNFPFRVISFLELFFTFHRVLDYDPKVRPIVLNSIVLILDKEASNRRIIIID